MADLMPRPRETPDPASTAVRNEIRMRELDRANRRSVDVLGDTNLVGRHTWAGDGNIVTNTDVMLNAAGHWPVTRDDGIATFTPASDFDVPGFRLGRAGRWSLVLLLYSDCTAAGVMRVALVQDPLAGPDLLDGLGELRDSRYRGAGFAQAGRLDQLVQWTGPVSEAEAANPMTVRLRWDTAGTALASCTWRFQANYLGAATATPAPIAPVAAVPQDDGAA